MKIGDTVKFLRFGLVKIGEIIKARDSETCWIRETTSGIKYIINKKDIVK